MQKRERMPIQQLFVVVKAAVGSSSNFSRNAYHCIWPSAGKKKADSFSAQRFSEISARQTNPKILLFH